MSLMLRYDSYLVIKTFTFIINNTTLFGEIKLFMFKNI
jgi:hypothetical protein